MGKQKNYPKQSQKVELCPLNIMSCNVRGISNKKKSIENILIDNEVDICILSELNTQNLPKFPGYMSFVRYSKQKFHGICILVKNHLSKNVLRIPDESQLEAVHIRIGNTIPAINIIGTYLPVESRTSVDQVDAIWKLLTDKVDSILDRQEAVCIIGDLNRPIQARKPSHGTKLLNEWLEDGNMKLLNDLTPTRFEPNTKKGSVLDLAIVSDSILQNVKSFNVDSQQKMTPFSMSKVKGVVKKGFPDHLTINLQVILASTKKKTIEKKKPIINYFNKEGWANYESISNQYAQRMREKIASTDDIEQLDIELNNLDEEMQREAFGVTWVGPRKKTKVKKRDSKELNEMYQEQQEELGLLIEEGAIGKDLNRRIFSLKSLITGPKVKPQERMAINDPVTNELLTDPEQIKNVSLQHNIKILTKKEPLKEDENLILMKKARHEEMMNKKSDDEEWELTFSMFCKVTDKIKSKNKNMYKLFNKAGIAYKVAIFEFMKKIIKSEIVPQSYKFTTLTQIWKGKGSPLSLNNMRFIHMRGWKSKLLEALVTEKMKPKIVEATPKFQLGGMPGASSVEHLVVLKTWMKMKEQKKQNGIFSCYDMSKFFDKESLLDCMDTLNTQAGIDPKSYRLWYTLNEDTDIAVKTSVGLSDPARITDSIGQGSGGAALVSSLNIGVAIKETFKEEPSTKIGECGLNSLIFQDDISKLNDTLQQTREGCQKIDRTLQSKLLSLNYDKSKFLVIGTNRFRKKILKDVESNPIIMGSGIIEHSSQEKYLGDIISENGCKESITATIKERIRKLKSKCDDIIQVSDAPQMGCLNKGNVALKLFEAQIIPALLHNCESWIDLQPKHIKVLQKFQDKFVRKVLRIPDSTPKAIMQYDTGMWPMEWRIKYKKVNFVSKTMRKPITNITRKVLIQEFINQIQGLASECYDICWKLKIDFVLNNDVSSATIKQAVIQRIQKDTIRAMENSKKVGDRLSDVPQVKSYFETMSLTHCRVWFRYRARCIAGVKANAKRSHADLSCRFCDSGSTENQEHLEVCGGFRYERRGLKMDSQWGLLQFWRRSSIKLAAVAAGAVHLLGDAGVT